MMMDNSRTFPQPVGLAARWTGMESLESRLLLAATPQPAISIGNAAVVESNNGQTATLSFDVTRSGSNKALRGVTVVQYEVGDTDGDNSATEDTDFTGSTARIRFGRGETTKTITVEIIGDDVFEGSYERLFVTATGGNNYKQLVRAQADRGPRGSGFIVEDDTAPQLSIADASVAEGDDGTATLSFDVTIDQAAGVPVYFIYSTADGTATDGEDYTATTGGFGVIPAGQTTATVNIDITGDEVYENGGVDEDLTVTVDTAVNATLLDDTATGTITEDDTEPTISVADVTVDEDAGTMTYTVTLSNPSDQTVTVDYTTTDATAEDENGDDDYTSDSDTLSFAPGETSKTVVITINDDATDEDNETFTLDLSNANNATIDVAQATGTITDDDAAPTLSIADVTVGEADGTATFTISLSAASGKTVTVLVNTANGTATVANNDYDALGVDTLITFNPGDTSETVDVTIEEDVVDDNDETFSVVLSGASNATIADATGVGTITDND